MPSGGTVRGVARACRGRQDKRGQAAGYTAAQPVSTLFLWIPPCEYHHAPKHLRRRLASPVRRLMIRVLRGTGSAEAVATLPQASALLSDAGGVAGSGDGMLCAPGARRQRRPAWCA